MSEEKGPMIVLCPVCGLHAYFLFSNGKRSVEFPSYERGLEILLEEGFPRYKSDEPELFFFVRELSKSSIPMYTDLEKRIEDVFGYTEIAIHSVIRMMMDRRTQKVFHERIAPSLLECHPV